MKSICEEKSSQPENRGGTPTRGSARKIGTRVDSQARALGAPERRVDREREQHRDVDAHAVGDVDRLVGIVDADVHVQAEEELLAGDEAQRGHEVAVAVAADDPLVLPHRERMRPGRADRQPVLAGHPRHLRAQRAQLRAGGHGVRAGIGRDLEHRLHQLRLDLTVRRGLEQALDRVDEVEALGVDDHQLFLDADRVAGPGEAVLHARQRTRERARRPAPIGVRSKHIRRTPGATVSWTEIDDHPEDPDRGHHRTHDVAP